jgi:hypothetical protein
MHLVVEVQLITARVVVILHNIMYMFEINKLESAN